MEKFRQRVKLRITMMTSLIILIGIVNTGMLLNHDRLPTVPDFTKGFQTGVFTGLELMLVFFTVRSVISLKSEEMMKKLYIQENDERKKLIRQMTGGMGLVVCMIGIAFAALIAAYFDQTVFLTLLGALVFIEAVMLMFKLYFHWKY